MTFQWNYIFPKISLNAKDCAYDTMARSRTQLGSAGFSLISSPRRYSFLESKCMVRTDSTSDIPSKIAAQKLPEAPKSAIKMAAIDRPPCYGLWTKHLKLLRGHDFSNDSGQ
jgi:hypothetical protein